MRPRHFVLTGNENHRITLEEASTLTRNYRESHTQGCALGGFFTEEVFTKILHQEGCVGIRVYLAESTKRDVAFILAGAEANGNDLFQGVLGANPVICPPFWSQFNDLNSTPAERTTPKNEKNELSLESGAHFITLAEASMLTRDYRKSRKQDIGKGGFFGRNIFEKILAQSDCIGIRIYHGVHDDGKATFVLVGVNKCGDDLSEGVLGQQPIWCPPYCFAVNPLNS